MALVDVIAGQHSDEGRDVPATRSTTAGRSLRGQLIAFDLGVMALLWATVATGVGVEAVSAGVLDRSLIGAAWAGSTALAICAGQLYRARVCEVRWVEVVRLVTAVALGAVVAGAVAAIAHVELERAPFVGIILGTVVLFVAERGVFRWSVRTARAGGTHLRDVALVGADEEAAELLELLHVHPELGYRIVGVVADEREAAQLALPWLGPPATAARELRSRGIHGAIVAVGTLGYTIRNRVVRELLDAGIHVQISTGLQRVGTRRMRVVPFSWEPLLYVERVGLASWQRTTKRAFDVVVASVALVVSAPILLLIALAVKLSDGGPVLYRQLRVGRDRQVFSVLKFRTMVPDADRRLGDLVAQNERCDGPLFKLDHDPRVTRVGALLRATSLDELPQLLNVLRGEMSLVGPRPPLPAEVEQFDDELCARFRVPPGITGLWQVEARDNPSFHAYRRLDLFYVENWSLTFDLAILVTTVEAVFLRVVRALADARSARSPMAFEGASPAGAPLAAAADDPEPATT